jgi:hypothetical protein
MICHSDLINSFLHTTLTQAEIDRFMAHFFDKDSPVVRPATVPMPYCSENPPPVVRISTFIDILYLHC